MKFAFEVGDAKARVEFYRDWWLGTLTITVDGTQVAYVDPTRLSTHFNFNFVKRFTFVIGEQKTHEVTIEHERPVLFAGLRPNTYRVFVDGLMTEEHCGY